MTGPLESTSRAGDAPGEAVPIEALKALPFFQRLSDTLLRKLQPHVSRRPFAGEESLLRLGEYSDAAYYVLSGAVEVRLPATPAPGGLAVTARAVPPASRIGSWLQAARNLAQRHEPDWPGDGAPPAPDRAGRIRLGEGEIFGELGALSRYPVTADVVGLEPGVMFAIRTPALRMMLKQESLADFRRLVDDRYRTRALATHLRGVSLFAPLDDGQIARLRDTALLRSFDPGQRIAAQGEDGASLLLVRGGFVKVSVQAGETPLTVTYLRKGDYAGAELALGGGQWPFSLEAVDHVELVALDPAVLADVLAARPELRTELERAAGSRTRQVEAALVDPLSSRHLQMAIDTGLVNGESVLLIDLTRCTGCDDCVQACADTHGGIPRFVRQGRRYEHWAVAHACHQCLDPVCMIGCPTGAITRPLGTLEVTIDAATCIGCGNCARRCPWDNILTMPRAPQEGGAVNVPVKCDLCAGRSGGPACVQMCPHDAAVRLSFREPDVVARVFGSSPGD